MSDICAVREWDSVIHSLVNNATWVRNMHTDDRLLSDPGWAPKHYLLKLPEFQVKYCCSGKSILRVEQNIAYKLSKSRRGKVEPQPSSITSHVHRFSNIVKQWKRSRIAWNIYHGRLARWIKWRACDVGEAKEGFENELWCRQREGRVGEWAVT